MGIEADLQEKRRKEEERRWEMREAAAIAERHTALIIRDETRCAFDVIFDGPMSFYR